MLQVTDCYSGQIDLSIIMVAGNIAKDALNNSIKAGAKSVISSPPLQGVGAEGAKANRNWSKSAAPTACGCRPELPRRAQHGPPHERHVRAVRAAAGKISVISQSGALLRGHPRLAAEQKLGSAKVIQLRNKGGPQRVDFIQTLAEDKETKVIAGYLEASRKATSFCASPTGGLRQTGRDLKVGITSAAPSRFVAHGSLAGATWLRRGVQGAGVIRAENFEALFDYATGLHAALRMASAWPSSPMPAARHHARTPRSRRA